MCFTTPRDLHRLAATVNVQNDDGQTPLHLACQNVNAGAAVELLLRHGASANAGNAEGATRMLLRTAVFVFFFLFPFPFSPRPSFPCRCHPAEPRRPHSPPAPRRRPPPAHERRQAGRGARLAGGQHCRARGALSAAAVADRVRFSLCHLCGTGDRALSCS